MLVRVRKENCSLSLQTHAVNKRQDIKVAPKCSVSGDDVVSVTPAEVPSQGQSRDSFTMAVVQLPFVERLRLVPSAVISIEVEVRNKPYRFNFNLTSDEKSVATRSLHISIRFDKKVIIFNSIRDGKWDGEEPVKNFPFRRDSEFELSVRVTKSTYELSVDGKPVYTYKQRLPHNYSSVNFINLQDSTKGSAPGFILTSFKVSCVPLCSGMHAYANEHAWPKMDGQTYMGKRTLMETNFAPARELLFASMRFLCL